MTEAQTKRTIARLHIEKCEHLLAKLKDAPATDCIVLPVLREHQRETLETLIAYWSKVENMAILEDACEGVE